MTKTIVYPPTINWTLLYQRPQFVLGELVKNGYECVFFDSNPPYEGAVQCNEPYTAENGVKVVPASYPVKELGDFDLYYSFAPHNFWLDRYKPEFSIFDNLDYPTEDNFYNDTLKAIKNAQISLAVSDCLLEMNRNAGKCPSLYIPNGVDYAFFAHTEKRVLPEIQVLKEKYDGIIGFTGVFWEQVTDWSLFKKIANEFPNFAFVMTGSFFNSYGLPEKNMYFLGHVPREDLPSVMASFDVGVIPFLENNFTKAMCPLKYFEYLATGIPVVSTPIPEVEKTDKAFIARDPEEFFDGIFQAVEFDCKRDRKERQNYAQLMDWSIVLEPFIAEYEEVRV